MVRQLTLAALALLALAPAVLAGCGAPEGSEGKSVSPEELNRSRAATAQDDGVAPPAPPSDSAPGTGR